MGRFYYDLHTHSCLSPCGNMENTPALLAGLSAVNGLNIVALTDHNTAKNCPAFFKAAEHYGVIPIAGMELTTAEDIHILCLFETLENALRFGDYVETRRIKIKNRPEIFGEQIVMNENDEPIGSDEFLLSNATTVSVDETKGLLEEYGGIAIPAHIDRASNSIISVLGILPEHLKFSAVEFHNKENISEYTARHSLSGKRILIDSDAHQLESLSEGGNYLDLDAEAGDTQAVVAALFDYLRG